METAILVVLILILAFLMNISGTLGNILTELKGGKDGDRAVPPGPPGGN